MDKTAYPAAVTYFTKEEVTSQSKQERTPTSAVTSNLSTLAKSEKLTTVSEGKKGDSTESSSEN